MLIFLYGSDDYRRLQKKRELVAEFRKKRSNLGLGVFDLSAKDWHDEFDEFTRSTSLFETARLAVFENAFEELEAPALAKLLKPFVDDKKSPGGAITILLAERDKPVKALAFLLEKPTISQKFENLAGAELINFIATEAKKLGMKISATAAQFLATVYAGNTWALATELQKLSSYKTRASVTGATMAVIERADLDQFDLEAAPNYWMLLNGLKSYDIRTRLTTLERLLAMNDPAAKIFNILAAQWKDLSKNSAPQMAEFDFAVKSGKLEYEEVLVDLMI
jgi:DNA polymerase III delta subunit